MKEYPDSFFNHLKEQIFNVQGQYDFNGLALEIFRFQYETCPVYKVFVDTVCPSPCNVNSIEEIPFLPVEVYKSNKVISGSFRPDLVFSSSGTTGMVTSRHFVTDPDLYHRSFKKCFRHFYGHESGYCILGLLPSYLERKGSSLVYMVDKLIRGGDDPDSGFFLYDHNRLLEILFKKQSEKKPVILFGVTFALLDFSEILNTSFPGLTIIETGGMKGRREEMIRENLHSILCGRFGVSAIHSEYGMTELLSQAYSKGEGRFRTPSWMKVMIRDIYDPKSYKGFNKTGAINIIDLANLYSCCFIGTQDLGRLHHDGSFEVLGRTDASDIRGCNLLVL